MRDYILSIVAAGIICAIINSLSNGKSATGKITKMLSGILVCITVISPVTKISFSNIENYLEDLSFEADRYVSDGNEEAERSRSAIIKSQTEAYILDKAKNMGLDISVEVELDESNNSVPCGITISGAVSPYIKEVMTDYIESQIGITRENQTWI